MKFNNLYSYGDFLNEKNIFSTLLTKIVSWFKMKFGKDAWLYYAKYLQNKNKLPKGVELYNFDVVVPSDSEINKGVKAQEEIESSTVDAEDLKTSNESLLNEKVELEHPDKEIENMNPSEIVKEIKRKYRMRTSGKFNDLKSLFIWGAPGIGKTDILKQVADDLDLYLIVWHLATIEPTDFVGVPMVFKDKGGIERTKHALPEIFPTSDGNKKGGILFFDELNRANAMVLSAALPLALSGEIGQYKLPPNWYIVAAGNRKEDIGGKITDLEPALANRFAHINMITSVEEWEPWAIRNNVNPYVIGFLKFNQDYFHKLEIDEDPQAWASPRSWTQSSQEWDFASEEEGGKLTEKQIKSIFTQHVGSSAANQFIEYLKLCSVFNENDIKEIWEKPTEAKLPPLNRIDVAKAICIGVVMHKRGKQITEKDIENIVTYAMRIENAEVSTMLLSYFKKTYPYISEVESKNTPKTTYDKKLGDFYMQQLKKWMVRFKSELSASDRKEVE